MRNPLILLGMNILFLGLFSLGLAQEESTTFTTYYPSPYGVYREMRAHRMAIGDTYINYSVVCWEGDTECTGMSGQVKVPAATDLLVQGNVGIGTTTPQAKLDIAGGVKVSNDTAPASTDKAGTIRWTGTAFEGCTGSAWIPLGGGFGNLVDVTSAASTGAVQGPVSTDGILIVGSRGATSGINIYVGDSPSSLFVITHENSHGAVSLTAPVKKGYYWKTEIGTGFFEKVYWIPYGS